MPPSAPQHGNSIPYVPTSAPQLTVCSRLRHLMNQAPPPSRATLASRHNCAVALSTWTDCARSSVPKLIPWGLGSQRWTIISRLRLLSSRGRNVEPLYLGVLHPIRPVEHGCSPSCTRCQAMLLALTSLARNRNHGRQWSRSMIKLVMTPDP